MMNNVYGFSRTLPRSVAEAVSAVTAALKEEGFGVLTEIDVKSTLKAKIGVALSVVAIPFATPTPHGIQPKRL